MPWTNFQYYASLAAAGTYTPTAKAIASFFNGSGALENDGVHLEFYDGAGWNDAVTATPLKASELIFQDTNQNIRIANAAAGANKISLTGVTWS